MSHSSSPRRVIIAGGGTGGHVFPALAVARELRRRGVELLYVGAKRGMEARAVPEAGFPIELLDVEGLAARSLAARVVSLAKLPFAVRRALSILQDFAPDVVLGVGGYASGPVILASWIEGVPSVLHEQNVISGFTNRVASRFAAAVAVSFAETARLIGPKAVVTGNPVREEFFAVPPPRCAAPLQLLVFGGSQGSLPLNRAVVAALPLLKSYAHPPRIVHQTGERWLEHVKEGYHDAGYEAEIVPFIKGMAEAMAEADLVLGRSGASSVAELAAAGRGAILVPFAAAAHDHQTFNARMFAEAGAGHVLAEAALGGESLAAALAPYLADPVLARALGERARTLARPDAARCIADLLESSGR